MVRKRPDINIIKSVCYRDEDCVNMYSCFFVGLIDNRKSSSFEEIRGVRKILCDKFGIASKKITLRESVKKTKVIFLKLQNTFKFFFNKES